MCYVKNNITWDQTKVEYSKIRLKCTSNITCGYISKHVLRCMNNISQKN